MEREKPYRLDKLPGVPNSDVLFEPDFMGMVLPGNRHIYGKWRDNEDMGIAPEIGDRIGVNNNDGFLLVWEGEYWVEMHPSKWRERYGA